MKTRSCMAGLVLAALCAGAWAAPAPAPGKISHGRFNDMPVYRPTGEVKGFALLLSGNAGWDSAAQTLAETLVAQGTMVAGIDTTKLIANLEADPAKCVQPDGDMENLSRFVQAYEKLPTYFPPIVVGQGSGAALAYAMSAQAPATRFGGLLTVDFCPQLAMRKPFCTGEGMHFTQAKDGASLALLAAKKMDHPWIALQDSNAPQTPAQCAPKATQGFLSAVPGTEITNVTLPKKLDDASAPWLTPYKTAFSKLNAERPAAPPPPPATIADLPVIEVPTKGSGDTFAILLSGDGGWAGLDRDVAAALSRAGVPTVGVDSLRYFWTKRTPASLTNDMDRLIRYYLTAWKKSKVLMIGYSQGADVMPFVMNRLPAATRQHVPLAVMMGLGKKAAFEFQVTNWLTSPSNGLPIQPEVDRMAPGIGLCIYGAEEKDSSCPTLDPMHMKLVKLPGGHHFDGDYDKLARIIMETAHTHVGKR